MGFVVGWTAQRRGPRLPAWTGFAFATVGTFMLAFQHYTSPELLVGYFVSLVVRGAESAQTAGFVLLFPLVFASSVFVPVSSMPSWLQPFAKASPVTLTADAARTLASTGGIPSSLGESLAWIAGILAVFVPLSVWRYRRMS